MKSFFVVCALVVAVSCGPVSKKPLDDAEVLSMGIHPAVFDLEDGIVDTGYPGGLFSFNPFGNPFNGFMQSMEGMMTRLRDQMTQVMQRLPPDNVEWTDIANGKGNTTSTTKVINGHKVTINETTYGNTGDNSASVFKIRIVDVHPASNEDSESSDKSDEKSTVVTKQIEETTPKNNKEEIEKGSPEFDEETNEIPKISEMDKDDVETFGEELTNDAISDESYQSIRYSSPEEYGHNDIDFSSPVREIETNDVDFEPIDFEPIDLSNDIAVNQMLADSGAPTNPDAEVFSVDASNRLPYFQPYFQRMRSFDPEIVINKK